MSRNASMQYLSLIQILYGIEPLEMRFSSEERIFFCFRGQHKNYPQCQLTFFLITWDCVELAEWSDKMKMSYCSFTVDWFYNDEISSHKAD